MTIRRFFLLLAQSPARFIASLASFILAALIALPASIAFAQAPGHTLNPPRATASSSASVHQNSPASRPIRASASWYGPGFLGHETSTGVIYNPHKLTAATVSPSLPLGSTAEVKNLLNGRKVKVKIDDCGPFVRGRKVDLSSRAASKLKMKHRGVVPVEVRILHKPPDVQLCTTK